MELACLPLCLIPGAIANLLKFHAMKLLEQLTSANQVAGNLQDKVYFMPV